MLTAREKQALVREAARRTSEQGERVSVSDVLRELVLAHVPDASETH